MAEQQETSEQKRSLRRLTRTPSPAETVGKPWRATILRAITPQGGLLWEGHNSLQQYRDIYESGGSALFLSIWLQDPSGLAGDVFRPEWFQDFCHPTFTEQQPSSTRPGQYVTLTAEELLREGLVQAILPDVRELVSLQACDLAIKQTETSDYYARANARASREGCLYFEEIYQARLTDTEMVADMATAGRKYGAKAVGVESNGFQSLIFKQATRGHNLPFVELDPQGRDKVLRARPFAALCEARKVFFLYGARWNQPARYQLISFPGGTHDDMCLLPDTPVLSLAFASHDDQDYNDGMIVGDGLKAPTPSVVKGAEFLRELLSAGPMRTEDVKLAAKRAGIGHLGLWSGKVAAGVVARSEVEDSKFRWWWEMPADPQPGPAASFVVTPISALKEGDLVLTHAGQWRRIKRRIESQYSGEVVSIKPRGLLKAVMTPNHPVYCVPNPRRWARSRWDQSLQLDQRSANGFHKPRWVPAGEIRAGDWVLEAIDRTVEECASLDLATFLLPERREERGRRSRAGLYLSSLDIGEDYIRFANPRSRPVPRRVPVTPELCRLIGYYVAEGSRGRHNVAWAFNTAEEPYIAEVDTLLRQVFEVVPGIQTTGHGTSVYVSSWVLHDFFGQFGRGAPNKRLPRWVMTLPLELQAEVVKGMWRGDGCFTNDGGIIYSTSSRALLTGLRMILYRLGVVPGLSVSRAAGGGETTIAGKVSAGSLPLYNLTVNGGHTATLAAILGESNHHADSARDIDPIVGDFVYRRVHRVETQGYEGPVYNLEVAWEHSYQLDPFLVHNCDAASYLAEMSMKGYAPGQMAAYRTLMDDLSKGKRLSTEPAPWLR